MNVIKKIILFTKNIFVKQNKIEMLNSPKHDVNQEGKTDFIKSLKINTIRKIANKKIETLTCEGDGLGIQKKISY